MTFPPLLQCNKLANLQICKKGRELPYDKVQMSDYLLPDSCASLEEKFNIFKLRTEMNDMPYNFGKKQFCIETCQMLLTNKHILTCLHLNPSNSLIQYNKLLYGNVEEKIEVAKIFGTNLMKLERKIS